MKKLVVVITIAAIGGVVAYQLIFNSVRTITLSKKKYAWTESPSSIAANGYFWDQFHQGNYDSIPVILKKLTAAYLDNPNDIRTITHLAFTHMWALSEHENSDNDPSVIEHATLAQKYFGESYLMNPADTRILSFLSSVKLVNGAISNDKGLLKDGYLNGLKAIREWESFSAFSLAYTLSRLPPTDDKFKKGLKLMKTLAEGYAINFDPQSNATQQQIANMKMLSESHKSKDRVLFNSWIAPHNIEGFFMAYGDMLVKNGDWEEASDVYKLARYAQKYQQWDYKDVLERRINNAKTNVKVFRKTITPNENTGIDDAILVQTGIACRSCHQMSEEDIADDFSKYNPGKLLDKKFYLLE